MLSRVLKSCIEYNLTTEEYFALITLKAIRLDKDYKVFDLAKIYGSSFNESKSFMSDAIKQSLVDKGFLLFPKGFKMKEEFTDKTLKFFATIMSSFNRLWNAYPIFINLNGKTFITKSCRYLEMEELFYKLIDNDFLLANEICELVEENKDLLLSKFQTFIESKGWELLKAQSKNKPEINEF